MNEDVIYREIRDKLLISLQVDDIRSIIGMLRRTDWYSLVKERDERQRIQYEDFLNSEVACQMCGGKFLRRDLVSADRSAGKRDNFAWWFCAIYCHECADIIDNQYKRQCVFCGKETRVKNRNASHMACKECQKKHANIHITTEKSRVSQQNSRARSRGLVADLDVIEWFDTLRFFDYKCAYCGNNFDELDHLVPVALGGGTTKNNCIPACSTCNGKKAAHRIGRTQLETGRIDEFKHYVFSS